MSETINIADLQPTVIPVNHTWLHFLAERYKIIGLVKAERTGKPLKMSTPLLRIKDQDFGEIIFPMIENDTYRLASVLAYGVGQILTPGIQELSWQGSETWMHTIRSIREEGLENMAQFVNTLNGVNIRGR